MKTIIILSKVIPQFVLNWQLDIFFIFTISWYHLKRTTHDNCNTKFPSNRFSCSTHFPISLISRSSLYLSSGSHPSTWAFINFQNSTWIIHDQTGRKSQSQPLLLIKWHFDLPSSLYNHRVYTALVRWMPLAVSKRFTKGTIAFPIRVSQFQQ